MPSDSGTLTQRAGCFVLSSVMALVVTVGLSAPVSATPPAAEVNSIEVDLAEAEQAPCLDNVGITVVVDFQELGGGVNVRCAPGAVTSGFDALDKAGISYQTSSRSSGFLCKIAGKPANDPCINVSPGDAYWSYWVAPRGGQWCYANVGAAARRSPLPPGSVEGWSFSKDKQSTRNNPPRYTPPAPIPGQAVNPIPKTDCDATVPAPPNPGPTAPSTTSTVAPPASSGAPGSAVAGANGRRAPGGSAGSVSPGGSTGPAPVESPTADPAVALEPLSDLDPSDVDQARALGLVQTNADGSIEALGQVDLAADGSAPASPVGFVLAGVALVGLAGAGVVVARRRRATGSS